MRRFLGVGLAGLALTAIGGGVLLYYLDDYGITPRSLGPYVERRGDGHSPLVEKIGATANRWLVSMDRGELPLRAQAWSGAVGMQETGVRVPGRPAGQGVLVADSEGLRRAIGAALPGQVITILPGRYRIEREMYVGRPGAEDAPIVVRADVPGSVHLEMATGEGFKIAAPYWRFENLVLQGVCASGCDHAFHVAGKGHHFAAVNNLMVDFNAHVKVNAEGGRPPDHGLLLSNTLRNESVRATASAVTPVDLVAASHWVIRHNLVSDFIKGGGDRISYGMFAKGGGGHNLMEQNVVLCEDRLRGLPGQRVGLSLGGGGTGAGFCRDGKCITEQEDSILRANLIASCSDDGIYLNAAARSKLVHNTLVDTGGVTVRYPTSSATLDGNLVDGIIRSRDNGILHLGENRVSSVARLFAGMHPQRALFRDPLGFDFRWREPAERRASAGEAAPDLCGAQPAGHPRFGAFEDFSACLK
ncbi:hypothetical protein B0920_24240 [Massilia sp. KIM]|uniref:hypothetical protein n=1 Tax=Massilia sp. KIM TaxID=1955422 RepID=UPI00098F60F4|nr:hypothetical protein [Massilia sp. KIM]OON59487.1 hypothetical protein B0920_24240 [Massilia sp. KIM]